MCLISLHNRVIHFLLTYYQYFYYFFKFTLPELIVIIFFLYSCTAFVKSVFDWFDYQSNAVSELFFVPLN